MQIQLAQSSAMKKAVRLLDDTFTQVFDALRDPCRYRIAYLLMNVDEACVSEVASIIDASLPGASRHLKVMERAGIVEKRRDGQSICYRIRRDDDGIHLLMKIISSTPKKRGRV